MNTDPFTEAARAEAERANGMSQWDRDCFMAGAEWASTHLTATLTANDSQSDSEPTDAEVEAAARVLLTEYQSEYDGGHLAEFTDLARAALSAARRTRGGTT